MNFITQKIHDAKVQKEINEMDIEVKRILNLLRNDNVPIELIKMRNTKNYFKKEKLPYLTTTTTSTEITNKKNKINFNKHHNNIEVNTLFKTFQRNNQHFNKAHFIDKYSSVSESIGKWSGNVLYINDNSQEIAQNNKLQQISNLSPEIFIKKKKNFNALPLMIKKQKRNFHYMKGQVLEDLNVVGKYYKRKGLDLKIQNSLGRCGSFSVKNKSENNFENETNENSFSLGKTMTCFKVQNFHFKKSLKLHKPIYINKDDNKTPLQIKSLSKPAYNKSLSVVQI